MVKNGDDMLNRFYLIPKRHGRTDGRTPTVRIAISITHVSVLTRDKKNYSLQLQQTERQTEVLIMAACQIFSM